MNWPMTTLVFIITWWMVFFTVLPFGVTRQENPEKGHSHGAPKRAYLAMKLIVTTFLAILVTGFIMYLIAIKIIPLADQ